MVFLIEASLFLLLNRHDIVYSVYSYFKTRNRQLFDIIVEDSKEFRN